MVSPIALVTLAAGLVSAESLSKTDVNKFSNVYNSEYTAAIASYSSVLAGQGFNSSFISNALLAYGYGTNTFDQTAYEKSLSSYLNEQTSLLSVMATASVSFPKQSNKSGSQVKETGKVTVNVNSGNSSRPSNSSSSRTTGGSESKDGLAGSLAAPLGAVLGAVAIAFL